MRTMTSIILINISNNSIVCIKLKYNVDRSVIQLQSIEEKYLDANVS